MKMIKTICLQYKVCELTTRIREIIIKINKSKNNFEKQPPNQNVTFEEIQLSCIQMNIIITYYDTIFC
jgi:hypothetical protein